MKKSKVSPDGSLVSQLNADSVVGQFLYPELGGRQKDDWRSS